MSTESQNAPGDPAPEISGAPLPVLDPPFDPYQGSEPYIFVTYSHDDKTLVFPELLRLRALGVLVWYDEGIDPGAEEWPEQIARALLQCSAVLFFVTPRSVTSKHCRREYQLADSEDKPIVPVYLEPTTLPGSLQLQMSIRQAIYRYELTPDHYERKLKHAVQPWIESPTSETENAGASPEISTVARARAEPVLSTPTLPPAPKVSLEGPAPSRFARTLFWMIAVVALVLVGAVVWRVERNAHTPPPTSPVSVRLWIGNKVIKRSDGSFQFGPPMGFIDQTGKTVIPPKWDYESIFTENLSTVTQGDKWGFIDLEGNAVILPKWDEAAAFLGGLARVKQGGKWGFIDPHGTVVIAPTWDGAGDFFQGLAAVKQGGKWGFIDPKGTVVIAPTWKGAGSFSQGLAVVEQDDKWGFIDPKGTVVIPAVWSDAGYFFKRLANVQKDGKWGFIDSTGTVVIPLKWDYPGDFFEDIARVKQGDKWGSIDRKGTVVIPLEWDEVGYVSEGLVSVEQGKKWGYVDPKGAIVIPPRWDSTSFFFGGFARVKQGDKWGLIDPKGAMAIPLDWDDEHVTRMGENGPVYHFFFKKTGPAKALAVWLAPDLHEIWRAELPLEEEKK